MRLAIVTHANITAEGLSLESALARDARIQNNALVLKRACKLCCATYLRRCDGSHLLELPLVVLPH